MFFFAPFNISARLPPPPPPNWHFIQGACCNQPHRDFFKILLNRLQEKKRKANHFKYKLSWVVRKHYHGNQNRTAFQKKKMMKGNKATIPGGKAVVVILPDKYLYLKQKKQHRFHFFPYSFMSNYASINLEKKWQMFYLSLHFFCLHRQIKIILTKFDGKFNNKIWQG